MVAHVFDCAPAQVGWPREVDGEGTLPGGLPFFERHFIDRVCLEYTGVVDQDIEPAKASNGLPNDLLGHSSIGDIARAQHMACAGKSRKRIPGRIFI
jgi:hypothetical protein